MGILPSCSDLTTLCLVCFKTMDVDGVFDVNVGAVFPVNVAADGGVDVPDSEMFMTTNPCHQDFDAFSDRSS